jgi:hypothetical protein
MMIPFSPTRFASAHLNEFPEYYPRLSKIEKEADEFLGKE